MTNKLEQDKKIIANAPEGATHHAQGMHYLALNKNNDWMRYDPNGLANAKWFNANDFKFSYVKSFRSLNDIRENIALQERIAELEKELESHDFVVAKTKEAAKHITLLKENQELNFTYESCNDTNCIFFYVDGEQITGWWQDTDAEDSLEEFKNVYMAGYSKALAAKDSEIAELRKFQTEFTPLAAHLATECNTTDGELLHRFKHWLEILKLEQQAKALDSFAFNKSDVTKLLNKYRPLNSRGELDSIPVNQLDILTNLLKQKAFELRQKANADFIGDDKKLRQQAKALEGEK